MDIYMDLRHQHCLGKQHGPWAPASPLAVVWIMDIKMALGSSTDHGGLLRRPNAESKPLFISDILLLLSARAIVQPAMFVVRAFEAQVAVRHRANPTR